MRRPEQGVSFISRDWDPEIYKYAKERADRVVRDSTMDRHRFIEFYGSQKIDDADRYVAEMQAKFASQETEEDRMQKQAADIFEAMLHDQSKHWLGEDVTMHKTDPYDDIKHGIDEVMEWRGEFGSPAHMGLSIDVTFSASIGTEKKIRGIIDSIDRGELPTITFFEGKGIRGELTEVPKVVVGAGKQTLHSLTRMWVKSKEGAMIPHPMGWLMYQELLQQCAAYRDYARGKGRRDIADKYDTGFKIVSRLHSEAEADRRIFKGEDTEQDPVFSEIKNQLSLLR
jgi:hypothetical protein